MIPDNWKNVLKFREFTGKSQQSKRDDPARSECGC